MKLASILLTSLTLAACGGGGGSSDTSSTPPVAEAAKLTVTGTAATGLAIAGATVNAKCAAGTGTATTLADGSYALNITNGLLPCVLQVTNPVDGIKLHTVATGTGSTATANITPLTEMATARVLGSEPNVFFAAFDPAVATQKITTNTVQAAQTVIGLVLTGTVDTTALGNFISTPLKAATQGSPTSGDAQDKLLDALKLKLSSSQIATLATSLTTNQTTDAIKQAVATMTGGGASIPVAPVANAGAAQSVVTGTTVTLNASTSSAAAGKSLSYAWTLTSKPAGSAAALTASTTIRPTFVADVAGSYVVSLTVNDGTSGSSAAAVTVTASVVNAAPVANPGVTQSVVTGSVVTLDGNASSDANGDPLTYAWTLTSKPVGSTATLSLSTSAKPTFTADLAGAYVASLTVNDGKVSSVTATVSISAAVANIAIPFNSLIGTWDGIANSTSFASDSLKLTVSISGSVLTIKAAQFFDGTCEYKANLNATHDAVSSGTYQCSDFTSGAWKLEEMMRVDQADVYIRLQKDGTVTKRLYGLAQVGTNSAKVLPNPISSLVGTYSAIATGGPFGTDKANGSKIAITGTTLTITVPYFFSGTCEYSATIQADGKSIATPTYRCADFSTGTWSLNDFRVIGGNDFYLSISQNGVLQRAYGIR